MSYLVAANAAVFVVSRWAVACKKNRLFFLTDALCGVLTAAVTATLQARGEDLEGFPAYYLVSAWQVAMAFYGWRRCMKK